MAFGIDVATRTVIVTEKFDVDLINETVLESIRYSELARMFAEEILGTEVEDTDWAFGATTPEVAEYLHSFTDQDSMEIVQIEVGGKGKLH